MKKLLEIKHWQLFLLVFGIPMLVQVALMYSMFSRMGNMLRSVENPVLNPFDMFEGLWPLMGLSILFSMILYAWMWALGTEMHRRLPDSVQMNVNLFKVAVLAPVFSLAVIMFLVYQMFSGLSADPESLNPVYIIGIIPFYLIMFVSMFYSMYFCAKSLKAAEMQRDVSVGDWIVEFILIWFNIVGIWFLQPRINKLVSPPPIPDPADHLIG